MNRKIKYYFTFSDFVDDDVHWVDLLGKSNSATQATISDTLLTDYLIPRYSDGVVKISSSETPDYTVIKAKMLAWLNSTFPYYNKLISLFTAQENKLMDKLSSITTDERAFTKSGGNTNTMTAGAQHSTSRENDTPQNGGNWADDEHTSSISTNDYDGYTNTYELEYNDETTSHSGTLTTETDPATIIERLSEIREKYVNLYQEWAEYFKIFIYYPATFEDRNECGVIYYDDEEE